MAKLYAIVGSMERARLMLEAGVPLLQLRFKKQPLAPHVAEISRWGLAYPDTRLIINDDPGFARRVGAWGVHLGQEDLAGFEPGDFAPVGATILRVPEGTTKLPVPGADRVVVARAGEPLNLGISTHSDEELKNAMRYDPALLGFGPIFSTGSKRVAHSPQGVARLQIFVAKAPRPVVAIGGINAGNLAGVVATGVPMVAMIAFLDQFSTRRELRDLMKSMTG